MSNIAKALELSEKEPDLALQLLIGLGLEEDQAIVEILWNFKQEEWFRTVPCSKFGELTFQVYEIIIDGIDYHKGYALGEHLMTIYTNFGEIFGDLRGIVRMWS